ncbi:syntaxin protein [Cymbomonas tetramitiformis]|uniref:Syntaxin protein n=1 Tax=Cymbomonas tetramitiformis TaxID=36881 RepID=A0AAE0BLW3_9CHLO|nr:syntaxin protein [Cymbomonas tetramitiformis]
MSIHDVLLRCEALVDRYEKYSSDEDKNKKNKKVPASNEFEELYQNMEDTVDLLYTKAEESAAETNRAVTAQANAEIRRGKTVLRTDLAKLVKIAKKQTKGITEEHLLDRTERVAELEERIEKIPDGVSLGGSKPHKSQAAELAQIKIETLREDQIGSVDPSHYKHTEETRAFEKEFELAKKRQDADLKDISRGLNTLGQLGRAMDNELGKQETLIQAIDDKVDRGNQDLRNVNVQLKAAIHSAERHQTKPSARSTRRHLSLKL